ncbi:universal stress protein [Pontibacter sp. JAM-7]|uniref:universal stress protein n=1 Tax=Pontibacter sp. JAM-7 TaxID=3366581 RepID=UPI003AF5E21B
MQLYKKILLALDLTEECAQLREKARMLAEANDAALYLAHVIEPLSFAYGGDVPIDLGVIQQQLDEHAHKSLASYADKLGYPITEQMVITGHIETEIHRIAEEREVDLILVGSHGRHGLALLLGSTANGILHGAKCDVLAVRIST